MYNTYKYNQVNWNGYKETFGTEADQDSIVYNGYSLQNTSIITEELIQDNTPDRDIESFNIPRDDGMRYIGDYWRQKIIKLKGTIHKNTNSLLEAEIDNMKKYCGQPQKNLDIKIDGIVRRYVATLSNGDRMFNRRKGYHISSCPFDARFVCLGAFGKALNYDYVTYFDKTLLIFNETFSNAGTVAGKPYIAINITAASSITAIEFTNNTTGETITITRSFSANEYVTFDCENKECKVDGTTVDYSGVFPDFEVGSNSYTITFTGASIIYTITTKLLPLYL